MILPLMEVSMKSGEGHSSITITVDTYTHWIEKAERGDVLEVDRLSRVSSGEAVTQAVTLTGATA